MVNYEGIIIHKTAKKKGKRHDYDIYKKNQPITPKQVVNVLSRIPCWHRKGFSNTTTIYTTIQKEEMYRKSQEEINFNLQHAKKRIVIEHTICRLKKYRIMNDVSRKQIKKIQQGIRYSIRTD